MATYDELRVQVGRIPIEVLELDLDFCTRTYGSAPCTAAVGVTGTAKCYNTRATCQDPVNYDIVAKTYRFSLQSGGILKPNASGTDTAIPSLKVTRTSPTVIEPSEGIGVRGSITATLQDESSNDLDTDPYLSTRTYDPSTQGTYWGKLLARNPFYNGRPMRYKIGYFDDSDRQYKYQTRSFVMDKITGPDASGRVTITGKDILKLADDKRAQAPFINTGVLDAAILAADGSATLSPAGIGNAEYAASGSIRIEDEIISFTRIGDALTLTGRGTDNTTAEDHAADSAVQQCLRYTATPINTILYELLNTYANIDASYLDTVGWQAEVDLWLSGNNYTALITEAEGVAELLTELTKQGLFYIWWDEIDQLVKLKAIAPPRQGVKTLSDAYNIISGSMKVADDEERRLSQVWVVYGIIDPTGDIDKISNFSKIHIAINSAAEEIAQYGDKRVRTIYSRWMSAADDGLAVQLGGRLLARFGTTPKSIEFKIDASDSDLWTGSDFTLETASLQTIEGGFNPAAAEILSIEQLDNGSQYKVIADLTRFSGRYAVIGPDSLNDGVAPYNQETGGNYELETGGTNYTIEVNSYSTATDADKLAYGWICYDSGFFLDGSPAYKII